MAPSVAAAIAELRRSMRAPDARTAGSLYWYALSGGLARLAAAGRDAATAPVRTGPGGWPETGEGAPSERPGVGLARAYRALIPEVAAASRTSERALWAIGTDSVASAALGAADPHRRAQELLAECAPQAPAARFETVPGRGTVVRRGSCCLLYLCPDAQKCLSCPRQTPEERLSRLRA
ncbi:(2Fe-2S)-binding protein [Tsukamurella sp. 1534]|uniref:(2Fe-2S)-binding protein n=1 Tax=Tsukamurella sp. 1534 TaxID=1151061 RepID=UPI0002D607FF|nr:(2Fe-2S)-binding protein [Tsukamurella sp. 1534]